MSLVNMLSNEDLAAIAYYIDNYAVQGTDADRIVAIEHILRVWDSAKSEYLYNMFGHEFILSKDFTYARSTDQLAEEIADNFQAYDNNDLAEFRNKFCLWQNIKYGSRWSERREHKDVIYCLESLINPRTLAKNYYSGDTFEIPTEEGKSIKIQHGCKPLRALNKIAEAFNIEGFEKFRIAHSMVLNQKMLKGELCLSIHPLDYMTMSDNDCGWSSCMSWSEDGCYKQGTVEMMNSPMVVVAYLRAKEDMKFGGFQWNSKKWRELFIVNKDIIVNVKGYPYRNEHLSNGALAWLKELAEKAGIGHYSDTLEECHTKHKYGEVPSLNIKKFIFYPSTDNMYNDFNKDHYMYLSTEYKDQETLRLPCGYSGFSECMLCGQTDPGFESEGYLAGTCCYESAVCEWCGDYVDKDDLIEVDGQYLCRNCYVNNVIYDSIYDKPHINDNYTATFHITFDHGETICSLNDLYIYDGDMDEDILSRYFTKMVKINNFRYTNSNYDYLIDIDNVTEKGLRDLFHYNSVETFKSDCERYDIEADYPHKRSTIKEIVFYDVRE